MLGLLFPHISALKRYNLAAVDISICSDITNGLFNANPNASCSKGVEVPEQPSLPNARVLVSGIVANLDQLVSLRSYIGRIPGLLCPVSCLVKEFALLGMPGIARFMPRSAVNPRFLLSIANLGDLPAGRFLFVSRSGGHPRAQGIQELGSPWGV
jgi:hypothetical protein